MFLLQEGAARVRADFASAGLKAHEHEVATREANGLGVKLELESLRTFHCAAPLGLGHRDAAFCSRATQLAVRA